MKNYHVPFTVHITILHAMKCVTGAKEWINKINERFIKNKTNLTFLNM